MIIETTKVLLLIIIAILLYVISIRINNCFLDSSHSLISQDYGTNIIISKLIRNLY